ncbi:MAG: chromosome segregation protein [Patescibacteria group bacterium]|nr:chromosome segregation protein [Patescibacteria group bacterium]
MYLKKIEISGFKSFATKTVLDFSGGFGGGQKRGITAVVGPNGSGKSNIADALRWVMGEQSMKNLRGKKSEDIIFAGSGKKARLGSAGVTLYLDNSDKKIPLEFSEVSVARKIYRSGESEFLVNGSKVRLQDIVDILAKAGVGKQSYAIINQGMADSVLNATPFERRSIIEDAAGVKIYQIKKERSVRKLESTRENLDKARALAEEIKPHLRLLKRQAEKASQSEHVARELKDKQTKLFAYLWNKFQEEKEKFTGEKDELGRTMMNIQREADKLTDEINRENKEAGENKNLPELESKLRQKRNILSQSDRELIITEGRIEIEKERNKNVRFVEEIKIESVPVNSGYVKRALDELRADQEKLIKRIEGAESLDELQDIKEYARAIQQKLYELRADMEKGKKEIENDGGALEKERQEKIKKFEEQKEAQAKVILEMEKKTEKLRQEIKIIEKEIQALEKEIDKEIQLDKKRRQNFFEVERNLRLKQDELNKFKDKFNESKISLARIEVREEDLRAQVTAELKKSVEELPVEYEDINRDSLEREIAKLKMQMEQIGGIDPMVIDEYEETNKRFEFLTGESADLENAIVSLKEVIKEMDQKIEKEFAATYEEINKEFSKYFRIIFGGGSAHLSKKKEERRRKKVDETEAADEGEIDDAILEENKSREDEAEVGIEISACPPGKKIANLSMLSGGERSLTSLALLFAIISHNPPPFAVLDEVEAALDEANSKRFGRILTELSQDTQFVTITHNRETMRQASLLYGVTMGEDGISKLLSVKLDQVGAGGRIIK